MIFIKAQNQVQEIVIYDITGKITKQNQILSSDGINLDLSRLTSGVYIMKIVTKNKMSYHKIIKTE